MTPLIATTIPLNGKVAKLISHARATHMPLLMVLSTVSSLL